MERHVLSPAAGSAGHSASVSKVEVDPEQLYVNIYNTPDITPNSNKVILRFDAVKFQICLPRICFAQFQARYFFKYDQVINLILNIIIMNYLRNFRLIQIFFFNLENS